jgi:hypothetical protein
MKRPWDEYLFRPLLHKYTRLLAVLVAVVLVHRWLAADPWWLWLPACFLAAFAALWAWLMLSYAYQKLTYPRRAAECKRRLRELRED